MFPLLFLLVSLIHYSLLMAGLSDPPQESLALIFTFATRLWIPGSTYLSAAYLSQTCSLIVAHCLLINLFPHGLAQWLEHRCFPMDVCGMNAWIIEWKEMKSGSFIPLQSACNLLVFLFPFSLDLTSPFSLLFSFSLFFTHNSAFLKLYNVYPVLQKALISPPLHRKMECAGDWSINVSAGQGNHSRDVVFLPWAICRSAFKGWSPAISPEW